MTRRDLTTALAGAAAGAAILVAVGAGAQTAGLIGSPQIRDGSVQLRDLSPAVRKQLRLRAARGPAGPRGPEGPAGTPAGTVAGIDPSRVTLVNDTADRRVGHGSFGMSEATCPDGTTLVGGGFSNAASSNSINPSVYVHVRSSQAIANRWVVNFYVAANGGLVGAATAHAVCVRP